MDLVHDHHHCGEENSKDREDYAHVANSDLLRCLRVESSSSSSSQRSLRKGEERIAWLRSQLVGSDVEFETPFAGCRRLVYADQTASGRCLHYIENYIIQHVLPIYGNTHTEDSFVGSKITRMVHEAAAYVKRCMGAGPEDALVFCGAGASAAVKRLQEVMGIAVPSTVRSRMVQALRDEERWVVFVGPYEHHSNLLSWRQSTAEVVEIGVDGEGLLDVSALRRELARHGRAGRPMIGSFSACSNVTGIVTDTRAVARILHRHGAFACFDFAARSCPPFHASMDLVHDHHHCGEENSKDREDYAHVANSELLRGLRVESSSSSSQRNLCEGEERIAWLRSELVGSDVEFKTPFAGRRRLVYADQTASGRCLHYIENYIIQHVLPIYGNTHTEDSFVGSEITRMVREAAAYVKRCMGVGPEDALLFCGAGASAAVKRLQEVMGIAVPSTVRGRMVQALRDEERWVVFVGPYEHHSNLLSWRQSTAEVVEIGVDSEGLLDVRALRRELARHGRAGRPMIGSFSACSNVTGIVTDTRAVARILHRHGAFACFDFAARSKKDTLYYESIEEREDGGTPPIIQKIRVALAFWVKSYVGCHVIGCRERLHAESALRFLLANPNIIILGNTQVMRLPIFSFLVFPRDENTDENENKKKPLHGRFVAKLLNDLFGIQARGGCACAGPYGHHLLGVDRELSLRIRSAIQQGYTGLKPGWTRVSFCYYMSKEECSFILSAIDFAASYGHRFLSLYRFDWLTGDWTFRRRCVSKHRTMPEYVAKVFDQGEKIRGSVTSREILTDKEKEKNSADARLFQTYLESAKMIAFSLPEFSEPCIDVPAEVDRSLILFRI
ncbi:uncharacterized protein LOC109726351 [Ananas comosus]|uniref:Uncharacterized protein LOC109726351 n=1 Tax=Ananas comosus TaxID=4615 RepID=A0A6P5GS39_ANACO|nr:uncharacterized protein LOC109726351 [Ananas comosus]